jgi:hypothetical protein
MRDFREIIECIKAYMYNQTKVYDKDVAKRLGINQAQFATLKRRNSTPYSHILTFCYEEGLCANELFFKS